MHAGAFFDAVAQDLRYAARSFLGAPAFTVTALFAIAAGIGATTAVFSVVDRILFRALPYPDANRIVSFGFTAAIEPGEFMLGTDYYEWRERQTAFESMTAWSGTNECSLTDRNPVHLTCALVEWTFLPVFGVQPAIGRNFTREEDLPGGPKAALISYGLWQSRFGRDPGVLGGAVSIDGAPNTVVGVLPRDFELPTLARADILMPRKLDPANQRRPNTGAVLRTFARLKPGVSIAQARASLEPLFQESLKWVPAQFRKEVGLRVRSLRDRQIADARLASWVLLAAVACVLVISCANVANLLLARAAARRRDHAVRLAIGAARARLIRQSLTESLLLAGAGGLLGCGAAWALLRLFISIAPGGVPRLDQASLDARVLLFTTLVSIVSGLLFGLAPAFEPPAPEDLTGSRQTRPSRGFLKQALIAGQMAISLALLTAAAMLLRTLWHVQNEALGMRADHVITATIPLASTLYQKPEQQNAYFEEVESRLSRIPGAKAVAVSDSVPPGGRMRARPFATLQIEGIPRLASGIGGMVVWRAVTPGYFGALGIPILRGRGFTERDRDRNARSVIFSEMLARKFFPDAAQAVGKHLKFTFDKDDYTIIGIAANVKNSDAPGAEDPEYYVARRHDGGSPYNRSSAIVRTEMDARAAAAWLRSELSGIDPRLPVEIETMHQRTGRIAARPRFNAMLLTIFAGIGLLLAAVGLYGVVSFLVAQRTQEIGVRMALGASRRDIVRMMLGRAARWIAVGALAGAGGSLAVGGWLKSLLFQAPMRDAWSLAAACAALIAVALIAAWIPARRAAMLDPVSALRRE